MKEGQEKVVALLQSNYIPWKGYFDIINMADEFVIYDEVQYTKNDWRNRNRIKTSDGAKWLTVPVKGHISQSISETRVDGSQWRRKHWRSLLQWYGKAEFFGLYRDVFEGLYLGSDEEFLSRVNRAFIEAICAILGCRARLSDSRDYELEEGKTERIVSLCRCLGARVYLTGPSAKDYLEMEQFAREGINVEWMDYSGYPEYRQLFPPFTHNVSVLDLIFNEGPDAPAFMKSFGKRGGGDRPRSGSAGDVRMVNGGERGGGGLL